MFAQKVAVFASSANLATSNDVPEAFTFNTVYGPLHFNLNFPLFVLPLFDLLINLFSFISILSPILIP